MRLVHSISMTLLVSAVASLSACSEPAEPAPATGGSSGAGGSGTSGTSGSGGSGMAGSGTGGTGGGLNDHPTDSTQAGIQAYLDANSYMPGAGWRPETMASTGTSPPHLVVKRYFNETLIASKAAGLTGNMHMAGSMAVKEILDVTAVVGKAAMLRTDTAWVYYCMSSLEGRCFTGSMPNTATYGSASAAGCACHGSGTIISIDVVP